MWACTVAVGERRDYEVIGRDRPNFGADILDDANELMSDGPRLEGTLAAVIPEIRAADAGEDHSNNLVRRLHNRGVWPLANRYRMGLVEDGRTHSLRLGKETRHGFGERAKRRYPVSQGTYSCRMPSGGRALP